MPLPKETISVMEAAERLDIDIETLRDALKENAAPFGWAYKPKDKWVYVIPLEAFESFMRGIDTESIVREITALIIQRVTRT